MRKLNLGMVVLAFGLLPAVGCAGPQYPYYYGYQPAPYYVAGFPYPVEGILERREELRLSRRQQARLRGIHERFRRENAVELERARREMENYRVRYGRPAAPREILTEQRYPRLFQNMRAARSEALRVLTPGQRQMMMRPGVRVRPR